MYPNSGYPSYPGQSSPYGGGMNSGAPSYPGGPSYPSGGAAPYPTGASPAYPGGGAAPYPTGGAYPAYPGGGAAPYPNIGFQTGGFDSAYPTPYPPTQPPGPPTDYPSPYPQTQPPGPSTGYPSPYPPPTQPPGPPTGYPNTSNFEVHSNYPSTILQGGGGGGYPTSNFGVHQNYPSTIPSSFNSGSNNFQVHQNYPNTTPSIYPNIGNNNYPPTNPPQQTVHYEGTLKPYQPFNPSDDAAKLYKAMKGIGTDETTLIDILCRRTCHQRQEIAINYKTGYGKDLLKNLVDETGGNFKTVFKALMYTPAQLEAHDLKKAIEGAGTDELSLIDILCTKSNSEMIELKNAFKLMYHKDLEREVGSDVSGYFKRLLVSLAAAHRSENPPDHQKAVQQAKELYEAGAKRLGTDEVQFNRIFASESFPHLKLVFEEYYKLTGQDIEKAIKSEMSGFVEKAFLAIVGIARNPPAYYAQRLYESMIGSGTFDRTLIRTIVLRSEKDMVQVKMEFQRRYGKTVESFIKGDCSGDYKRALLCLVGDSNWR